MDKKGDTIMASKATLMLGKATRPAVTLNLGGTKPAHVTVVSLSNYKTIDLTSKVKIAYAA